MDKIKLAMHILHKFGTPSVHCYTTKYTIPGIEASLEISNFLPYKTPKLIFKHYLDRYGHNTFLFMCGYAFYATIDSSTLVFRDEMQFVLDSIIEFAKRENHTWFAFEAL